MKKRACLALFIIGLACLCVSILLAVIETANADIIGGSDLSTFMLTFRTHRMYAVLMLCGIVPAIIATVVYAVKTQ